MQLTLMLHRYHQKSRVTHNLQHLLVYTFKTHRQMAYQQCLPSPYPLVVQLCLQAINPSHPLRGRINLLDVVLRMD